MIEKQKTSKDITALMWRTCAILTTTNIIKSQYYILQTRPICRITSNTSYISIHARLSKYMSCLSFYAQCFFFMFVLLFFCRTAIFTAELQLWILLFRGAVLLPILSFPRMTLSLLPSFSAWILFHIYWTIDVIIARPSPSKCGFISVDSSFSCFM